MSSVDFSNLSPDARIQLWREAIAHLRYLNDEVWRRFQLFLYVDLAIILAILIQLQSPMRFFHLASIVLAAMGFALTLTARYILKRNRIYYLQMLLKKTLLEKEAGFYDLKFTDSGADLALPWRLTPEVFPTLQKDPEQWIEQNIDAPKTIARRLFQVYECVMALFIALMMVGIFFALRH